MGGNHIEPLFVSLEEKECSETVRYKKTSYNKKKKKRKEKKREENNMKAKAISSCHSQNKKTHLNISRCSENFLKKHIYLAEEHNAGFVGA